ncbi:MAG: response regulator [Verrucomicrobiota bacterium]
MPASFEVLLIDDDPSVQSTIGDVLRQVGCKLHAVADGRDGIEIARQQTIHLVLLDLGLPDIDGFEVLRALKSDTATSAVPVIVLTAWNNTDDKVRGFELGASDYITKPFAVAELRARVQAALHAKQMQDRLAGANAQLDAARKVAEAATIAKSEFLARMCHEIRTPMNGVIGVTDLLQDSPLTADQREWVETIRSSGEALMAIVNDILDFSKVEAGKMTLEMQPFELQRCVEEAVNMLAARAAQKGIELAYQIEDGVPAVIAGDVTRLRQILVNLVGNGIKFTPSGEVVVTVGARPLPPESIPAYETVKGSVPMAEPQTWELVATVRDTGIGIPAERLPALFEQFTQVDTSVTRKFGGTGLGLAICRNIVDLMGGHITIDSAVGKGSTFSVTIPVVGGKAVEGETESRLVGARILIVDDNATNRRILNFHAQKWGMMPQLAENGPEALQLVKGGARFDVVILDMQMPGMDGLTLAKELVRAFNNSPPPLILLTSLGIPAKKSPDWDLFASCLSKPARPALLRSTIRHCLGQSDTAMRPKNVGARIDSDLARRVPLKILLVDDNDVNRRVAVRMLKQMGYEADTATNGVEAVEAVRGGRYDLVLMDVQMPELDGMEATRRIRAWEESDTNITKGTVIVAMTANAMPGDREKCLAAGMDDYFTKPVRPEVIERIIHEWAMPPADGAPEPERAAPAVDPPPRVEPAASPVDMERLNDFSSGDPDSLRELVDVYLQQTEGQLAKMRVALAANDARELERVAHSCAGASATCGMRDIVPHVRELERMGHDRNLTGGEVPLAKSETEFARIRTYLEEHLKSLGKEGAGV